MNLENQVEKHLWNAIRASIENQNYTGAIIDAIYFLSDLIREKTGLSDDGVSLAGQAFGGKNPKLKVNKLQTESEKNIQSGIEQIIRGLYQAIRNPRSHQKHSDSREHAEAIILFVNWLVGVIAQSKAPFTLNEYLGRVFDDSFVLSERYAKLLVDEIPPLKRVDVFLEVFRKKNRRSGNSLHYFFHALAGILSEEQKDNIAEYVSEELIITNDRSTIVLTLQCLPNDWWPLYKEIARLRIENKLIKSVRQGRYSTNDGEIRDGGLGTWVSRIAPFMQLKNELAYAITEALDSRDDLAIDYVFQYLFSSLPVVEPEPDSYTRSVILNGLDNGDTRYCDAIRKIIHSQEYEHWTKEFAEKINDVDDEIPF